MKLRSSITPGTVLILLLDASRAKSCFYKTASSGLLLVTGPYKLNGVSLKRVNQAYVIATKTKVDISSVRSFDNIEDSHFAKTGQNSGKRTFFAQKDTKNAVSDSKKSLQIKCDSQLIPVIKKVPLLSSYIGARFSLTKGQALHNIEF